MFFVNVKNFILKYFVSQELKNGVQLAITIQQLLSLAFPYKSHMHSHKMSLASGECLYSPEGKGFGCVRGVHLKRKLRYTEKAGVSGIYLAM